MWQPSWYSMPSFNWKIRSWKLQEEGYQKQWISYRPARIVVWEDSLPNYLITGKNTCSGWWLDASILILVRLHHDTLVCLCPHGTITIILLLFDLRIVSCFVFQKKSKSYYDLLERLSWPVWGIQKHLKLFQQRLSLSKKKFQQPITFYVCANVYSMSNLEPDPHAFRKREKLTRNYGVLFLSHA